MTLAGRTSSSQDLMRVEMFLTRSKNFPFCSLQIFFGQIQEQSGRVRACDYVLTGMIVADHRRLDELEIRKKNEADRVWVKLWKTPGVDV